MLTDGDIVMIVMERKRFKIEIKNNRFKKSG
jgi:hypothetical protein